MVHPEMCSELVIAPSVNFSVRMLLQRCKPVQQQAEVVLISAAIIRKVYRRATGNSEQAHNSCTCSLGRSRARVTIFKVSKGLNFLERIPRNLFNFKWSCRLGVSLSDGYPVVLLFFWRGGQCFSGYISRNNSCACSCESENNRFTS